MTELIFLKELMLIKNESKECDVCRYWYFLDKGFNFQTYVCIGFHDLLMMSINLNGIAVLNINGVYCRCNVNGIRKSEGINLLQNGDLKKKWDIIKNNFCLPYIRMEQKL